MKKIMLVVLILVAGLVLVNFYLEQTNLQKPLTFGVTFSPRYAKELELDPQKTYLSILKDLKVRNLRLMAYWDEIEREKDRFYFEELDWYINQAQIDQAQVILTIGYKLPRWPECRAPGWVDQANIQLLQQYQLRMLESVIAHYENNPTITAWQLENEPLLPYGICPPSDRQFLKKEVEFVRKITKKPIIISDSGELRPWVTPMKLSDIFSTTIYRSIYKNIFGYLDYPLPPTFYTIKSQLVRNLFAPKNQKTIIGELQAEPWSPIPLPQVPSDLQISVFSLENFKNNIDYAKKTGFPEAFLWGVEWWYYISQKGQPQYLEYAKTLF